MRLGFAGTELCPPLLDGNRFVGVAHPCDRPDHLRAKPKRIAAVFRQDLYSQQTAGYRLPFASWRVKQRQRVRRKQRFARVCEEPVPEFHEDRATRNAVPLHQFALWSFRIPPCPHRRSRTSTSCCSSLPSEPRGVPGNHPHRGDTGILFRFARSVAQHGFFLVSL
jgi:hypothetical protein